MPLNFTSRSEVQNTQTRTETKLRLTNRFRLTDWLLLISFPAFFFFWKLASFGLIGADEPRYAQVAREMMQRGDWITPTLGGLPWLEKPPLYYWQAILAYKLFGVSDWAARLPSVFDAFLLVIAIYWFLRRCRSGLELDGALICATTAGVVGFSRAASTDMPLAAMFSVAMLAWYSWFEDGNRTHLAGFYALIALAMLAKGPVAPLLALLIIAIFAVAQRSAAVAWKTLWLPGILIFCALALPWYALVQLRNPQFFHEFIIQHNLARFGTNLYHHPEPFWYYVPVTLLGWVPWTFIVLAGLLQAVRRTRRANANPVNLFLLIWIAVVVVFFSISQSKLPGYILPVVPAGAVLAAIFVHDNFREGFLGWVRIAAGIAQACLVAALLFFAFEAQFLVIQGSIPWHDQRLRLGVMVVAAAALAVLLSKANWHIWRTITLASAILAVALALRLGAEPLNEKLSARPIANQLANFGSHHLPVALFLVPRETEFGLTFYLNQNLPRYELGQVPAGEHLVVAAQGYPRGVAKTAGREVKFLGNFAPQRLDFFYVPAR